MIRRDILEFPERVETMDLFNDSQDTIRWLKRVQHAENGFGLETGRTKTQPIIDRIEERYSEFLRTT